jgi:predicted ester cyclase
MRRRWACAQIDMLVAEGSRVTALLTFSSGEVPKNEATAVWTATSIMEFAGGQVVKTWVNSDALSALTQLGAPPPPPYR